MKSLSSSRTVEAESVQIAVSCDAIRMGSMYCITRRPRSTDRAVSNGDNSWELCRSRVCCGDRVCETVSGTFGAASFSTRSVCEVSRFATRDTSVSALTCAASKLLTLAASSCDDVGWRPRISVACVNLCKSACMACWVTCNSMTCGSSFPMLACVASRSAIRGRSCCWPAHEASSSTTRGNNSLALEQTDSKRCTRTASSSKSAGSTAFLG